MLYQVKLRSDLLTPNYNNKELHEFQQFFIFFNKNLEVPIGLEPVISELQSLALPTWLRNQRAYYSKGLLLLQQNILKS